MGENLITHLFYTKGNAIVPFPEFEDIPNVSIQKAQSSKLASMQRDIADAISYEIAQRIKEVQISYEGYVDTTVRNVDSAIKAASEKIDKMLLDKLFDLCFDGAGENN